MMTINKIQSVISKSDHWMVIGLFIIGILSRLPFRSQILYHWDSVNFALALDNFDIRLHQPHPPGTFVIYIMLGRLINWFLHNPNASLVWLSVLASGLSAALLFILGRQWFDKKLGLIAALLMLTSPLIWFHGEIALSYMLEFIWVLVIVIWFGKLHTDKSDKALFISALLIGLAGGIRPNTPVFLFPLWVVLAFLNFPIRKIFLALVIMAGGVMLWAIPMIVMTGGLPSYWELAQWWVNQHLDRSSSGTGTQIYMARFVAFMFYGLGFALAPLLWALYRRWRDLKHLLFNDWRAKMLTLWIIPGGVYLAFIHLKQSGHIFTILPALIIVVGLSIRVVSQDLAKFGSRVGMMITALIVTGNGLLFLFGPASLFGSSRSIFSTPTWAAIHQNDIFVSERLTTIREVFEAEETVVVAGSRYFRLPDFYLRDYQFPSLSTELEETPISLPQHIRTLILFDDSVLPQFSTHPSLRLLSLPRGETMRYVTWNKEAQVKLSQTLLEIEDK